MKASHLCYKPTLINDIGFSKIINTVTQKKVNEILNYEMILIDLFQVWKKKGNSCNPVA